MATASLEQVERMAAQLSPREQLKLVARIGERLSAGLSSIKCSGSANAIRQAYGCAAAS